MLSLKLNRNDKNIENMYFLDLEDITVQIIESKNCRQRINLYLVYFILQTCSIEEYKWFGSSHFKLGCGHGSVIDKTYILHFS